MLLMSHLACAAEETLDDVWQQISDQLDRRQWDDWQRSSQADRNEWTDWFAEQDNAPVESEGEAEASQAPQAPQLVFTDDANAPIEYPHLTSDDDEGTQADIFSTLRQQRPPLTPRTTSVLSTVSRTSSTNSRRGRRCKDDTEPRPHECEKCGDRFQRLEHLKRHISSVHSDEKPFVCDLCGKGFKRTDNMSQHRAVCVTTMERRLAR